MTTNLVALNNYGADLLDSGRLGDAAATFKETLKATRELLKVDPPAPAEEAPGSTNFAKDMRRRISPNMWYSDITSVEGSSFLVYILAERIDVSSQDNKGPSLNSISASVLFNLALTHHMKAISSPSQAAFAAVAQLYEHSYRLAIQALDGDHFLALATLNNLVHVQAKLHNMEDAERICGLLWGAVLEVDTEDSESSSTFEGFFANVVHIAFKHSHSAAAA